MSFGGGTNYGEVTAKTFTLANTSAGDIILVQFWSETDTDYMTGISGGGVTWDASAAVAHTEYTGAPGTATAWKGKVTAAEGGTGATVTVTTNAGSPAVRGLWTEISTTAGYASVSIDQSESTSGATTVAGMTAGHGAGELLWGWQFNSGSGTAAQNMPSGFTYNGTTGDANGNVGYWNLSCGTGSEAPAIGGGGELYGLSLMLYEAPPALTATAALAVTPSRSATAAVSGPLARTASLAVTPASSVSRAHGHARSASLAVSPSPSATAGGAGLVQETSGSTTGSTLTLTFARNLTPGNTLVIAMCGFYAGSVDSFTVGGVTATFAQYAYSAANSAQVWGGAIATASATLEVTTSVAGIIAWAYEVTGAIALDASAAATGNSASWSSGAAGDTIPYYPHFVVGLGTTVSAGSVTGPSSGWLNETAYSGVATGGQHAGGVSGYRVASSSAAFTYAGSATGSAEWGAVTAAFLIEPHGSTITGGFQPGWGGYVFEEHVGYTGVSASFTVPALAGGESVSIWAGMGNVYQTGLYLTYSTSSPDNTSLFLWTEMLPGGGYEWAATAYPVAVGDALTVSVQLTSADWLLTIANATEGWSFTDVKSVLSVNVGGIQAGGAGPAAWPFPVTTAEVIIEDENHADCPDYGTVAFTSVTTTPAIVQAPLPVITVNTEIAQYPGPFNLGAGSFTMYWNAYS